MKASAETATSTAVKTSTPSANQAFFAKAGGGNFFAPAIQMKLAVNQPGDKFEQEADKMADKVMRMPSPTPISGNEEKLQRQPEEKLQKKEEEKIQKTPATEEKLQRKSGDGVPAVNPNVQAAIQNKTTGGQALSGDVRSFMEPRFNADFSQVKIHNDTEAAGISNQLSARAFTYQNHVFFSHNQYQPGTSEGKQLLAHELTHTIQQGHAIQRSPQISTTSTPPLIQRWSWPKLEWPDIPNPIEFLINKAKGFIGDKAEEIYGFPMLTMIIGYNPITGANVDRSPGKILKAAIELIPGGDNINQALENHKVFDKISTFAAKQFDALKNIGSNIWQDIKNFLTGFSKTDLLNLGKAYDTAKGVISTRIDQIKAFAIGLKDGIVELVKDLILKPIAAYAKSNTTGYPLLAAILGKDPISKEKVPDDPETLIGLFLKFIGEEETLANMQKAKAVPRAIAWFKSAFAAVKGFVQEIPGLFITALKSLEIIDIILIPKAFIKLAKVFSGFAGRVIEWGLNAIWTLLEIIFDAFKPGVMGYIKKTGAALKSILKNPMPFVGNLVNAAKLGFESFGSNFGSHFKAGLIDWLTGSLVGVYIPKALSLPELGKLALSVLGITWVGIRKKLVKALGDKGEKIISGIEKGVEWAIKGFEIVKKIAEGGMAAAWEMIQEKLTDLKDQVISGITGFVTDTIIQKAIPKLIGMFIPGAGFIPAIISIYDTIMVFVEKLTKIAQVVMAFIDSIVAIASGNISAAARRVESILGGLLSLAISFLAGFLGLGKVTDKIKDVIDKVRDKVDKAIDAALAWVVAKAKALFAKLFGGKDGKPDERTDAEKNRDKLAAIAEAEKLVPKQDFDEKKVRAKLSSIKQRYKLLTLELIVDSKDEKKETIHFAASASTVVPGRPITVAIAAGVPVKQGDPIRRRDADGRWSNGTVTRIDPNISPGKIAVFITYNKSKGSKEIKGGQGHLPGSSTAWADQLISDFASSPESLGTGGYAKGHSDSIPDHGKYEPKSRIETNFNNGATAIKYTTIGGTQFEASISADKMTLVSSGTKLKLKESLKIPGRGVTQDSPDFIAKANLHRSHLIADRFLGSGYKSAANLVSASAQYNLKEMSPVENKVARMVTTHLAQEFDLSVKAEMKQLNKVNIVTEILGKVPAEEKASAKESVEKFANQHPNFKVILKVDYDLKLLSAKNNQNISQPYNLGPDKYLKL